MHRRRSAATRRSNPVLRAGNTAATIALLIAAPAAAVDLTATASIASDYRFRGVSLSDRGAVVDASVTAASSSWFAAVEGISSARGRDAAAVRRSAEVDVSAGWSRAIGLFTPTAGVIAYFRPGGGESVNAEGFATLEGALGPATLTVGANYAPDQGAAPGGNLYLFTRAAAAVPATPLTIRARVGREAGAFEGGRVKIDYAAGVEARVTRAVTLGIDYVGNDLPRTTGQTHRNRTDGVVVRAGVTF